jgi:uncharacterized protein YigE (DUF2233 family)
LKQNRILILITIVFFATAGILAFAKNNQTDDNRFVSYIADTKKQDVQLYWKDDKNENFKSIEHLKLWLEKNKRKLVFAMNAGMYKQDNSPQGLFIEKQRTLSVLDTSSGNGNFYLKPNGIFYITTDNIPVICNTTNFIDNGKIKYATQSGPMLVINGQIHPAFKEGSANINIRNGVGILPGNKIVFAMSKKEINFYDFANYFKSMGCKNALYLDGLVSRTYLPKKKWMQIDGNFGVIIGITTTTD